MLITTGAFGLGQVIEISSDSFLYRSVISQTVLPIQGYIYSEFKIINKICNPYNETDLVKDFLNLTPASLSTGVGLDYCSFVEQYGFFHSLEGHLVIMAYNQLQRLLTIDPSISKSKEQLEKAVRKVEEQIENMLVELLPGLEKASLKSRELLISYYLPVGITVVERDKKIYFRFRLPDTVVRTSFLLRGKGGVYHDAREVIGGTLLGISEGITGEIPPKSNKLLYIPIDTMLDDSLSLLYGENENDAYLLSEAIRRLVETKEIGTLIGDFFRHLTWWLDKDKLRTYTPGLIWVVLAQIVKNAARGLCEIRMCKYCKKYFLPNRTAQLYCSSACQTRAKAQRYYKRKKLFEKE